MSRPRYIVNIQNLPGEKRPRHTATPGVAATVRLPSAATGLTRMGVHVRQIEPGHAGTNRHFHTVEEEWAYVLAGEGVVRIGPLTISVRPGHFVGFPTGPRPHHFVAEGSRPLILLEGGERRPSEDGCWYPDARIMSRGRSPITPYEEPPPEQGDARQVVHTSEAVVVGSGWEVEGRQSVRNLSAQTGLQRQHVYWMELEPASSFTALRARLQVDAWLFVIAGRGVAIEDSQEFDIGAQDFIGHPAGGQPLTIRALGSLGLLFGTEEVVAT